MTYRRVVSRNSLTGNYSDGIEPGAGALRMIAGDLRRLEIDSLDDTQTLELSRVTGVAPEDVRKVLREFFTDERTYGGHAPDWFQKPSWPDVRT